MYHKKWAKCPQNAKFAERKGGETERSVNLENKISFAEKNERKHFCNSAIGYKMWSNQKSSTREPKWNPLISSIKCPYFFGSKNPLKFAF